MPLGVIKVPLGFTIRQEMLRPSSRDGIRIAFADGKVTEPDFNPFLRIDGYQLGPTYCHKKNHFKFFISLF